MSPGIETKKVIYQFILKNQKNVQQTNFNWKTWKDPEARGTTSVVSAFDVATTNYYVKKDGQGVEETEWTACVAFGKLAESILKQGKKGDLVLCEGMKKTDTYERDGVKRSNAYLQLDSFRRLSWNKESEKVASPDANQTVVKDSKTTKKIVVAP